MWNCPKCREEVDDTFDECWNCGTGKDGSEDPSFSKPVAGGKAVRQVRRSAMVVTTTPSIEGQRITRYCGVVTGEAILGADIVKDFFAGVTDIIGGRSAAYEGELRSARDIAMEELEQAAVDLGANAVVGMAIDYETIGNMLMVCVSGTAVVIE